MLLSRLIFSRLLFFQLSNYVLAVIEGEFESFENKNSHDWTTLEASELHSKRVKI